MCGIAGIISLKDTRPPDQLASMLKSIRHRGPDDEGRLSTDRISAGMRRLSIIDIEGGHQPLYNENQDVAVILNGEIYNYVELRNDLLRAGHTFRSQSDTEVIAHLYEEHGVEMLRHLNGMFSFALFDLHRRVTYVCRDHVGIKPLYYRETSDFFVFGSELKAVLEAHIARNRLSNEALLNYLNYGFVPSPKTPFEDIFKLEAGHYLKIEGSRVEKHRWYDLSAFSTPDGREHGDLVAELRSLLEDAVKLQMRSDVPVGTLLSGGLDSGLLTALASRHTSQPLQTFSVGFVPSEFDELPHARTLAGMYGTTHREIHVSSGDALGSLSDIMWHLDEPIGDSAVVPSFLVSRLASNHVKVVLSGLGGDELFGGYERYSRKESRFRPLISLPAPLLTYVMRPILGGIHEPWGREIDRVLERPDAAARYHGLIRQMDSGMMRSLLAERYRDDQVGRDARSCFLDYGQPADEINNRMYADIRLYMNDQLLHLTDRVSMAASLEVRVPLLDHRIVAFASRLPSFYKVSGVGYKLLLKEAIRDLLPAEVLSRPKWGFAAPHKRWVLQDLMLPLISETVDGTLVNDGVLDRGAMEAFLGDPGMLRKHPTWVWPLVSLELWYSHYRRYLA